MSNEDRTGGRETKTVLAIPVRAYEIAQYGSASGSFLDKAAVPNPCALAKTRQSLTLASSSLMALNSQGYHSSQYPNIWCALPKFHFAIT